MRGVAAGLAMLVMALAGQAQAQAQAWQPIEPAEARLVIAPQAFGTQGIQRWMLMTGPARYERWATRFDRARRFFQIILREVPDNMVVATDADIRRIVLQSWGSNRPEAIRWGQEQTVSTGLGLARVLPFQFQTFGCAGFHIPLGEATADVGGSAVEGLYCDPTTAVLPTFDIQQTLDSVGVAGRYSP